MAPYPLCRFVSSPFIISCTNRTKSCTTSRNSDRNRDCCHSSTRGRTGMYTRTHLLKMIFRHSVTTSGERTPSFRRVWKRNDRIAARVTLGEKERRKRTFDLERVEREDDACSALDVPGVNAFALSSSKHKQTRSRDASSHQRRNRRRVRGTIRRLFLG